MGATQSAFGEAQGRGLGAEGHRVTACGGHGAHVPWASPFHATPPPRRPREGFLLLLPLLGTLGFRPPRGLRGFTSLRGPSQATKIKGTMAERPKSTWQFRPGNARQTKAASPRWAGSWWAFCALWLAGAPLGVCGKMPNCKRQAQNT